jgi:16S rRNA (uracil1498-N3)-methyltransferase
MRVKKGADIVLFTGDGFEYTATVVDENQKNCAVTINKKIQVQRESPVHTTLLQGISRGDRMDACIQKSTELGVNTIIPVLCEHSSARLDEKRAQKKIKHWQQIIISACEQSGRCVIPTLQPITPFAQALESASSGYNLVLSPDAKTGLRNLETPEGDISILAGPESGLTQNEIKLALEMNFRKVQMGPRILRTETAAPACLAAIQTLWGDSGGITG